VREFDRFVCDLRCELASGADDNRPNCVSRVGTLSILNHAGIRPATIFFKSVNACLVDCLDSSLYGRYEECEGLSGAGFRLD
jgi:hypothetical protein